MDFTVLVVVGYRGETTEVKHKKVYGQAHLYRRLTGINIINAPSREASMSVNTPQPTSCVTTRNHKWHNGLIIMGHLREVHG